MAPRQALLKDLTYAGIISAAALACLIYLIELFADRPEGHIRSLLIAGYSLSGFVVAYLLNSRPPSRALALGAIAWLVPAACAFGFVALFIVGGVINGSIR